MKLYFHPISSYSQKVLIAAYEKNVAFTPQIVDLMSPAAKAEYKASTNPMGKVPMIILDDGWRIPESSIIVEYLDTHHTTGTRLIPEDRDLARRTRFHDRLADLYLNNPMQTVLFDGMKPAADREPKRVEEAKATIDTAYKLIDQHFGKGSKWTVGDAFTMADCSIAPCLFYLQKTHPFAAHKNLDAYWNRLAERPSVARVMSEAMPYLAKMMG